MSNKIGAVRVFHVYRFAPVAPSGSPAPRVRLRGSLGLRLRQAHRARRQSPLLTSTITSARVETQVVFRREVEHAAYAHEPGHTSASRMAARAAAVCSGRVPCSWRAARPARTLSRRQARPPNVLAVPAPRRLYHQRRRATALMGLASSISSTTIGATGRRRPQRRRRPARKAGLPTPWLTYTMPCNCGRRRLTTRAVSRTTPQIRAVGPTSHHVQSLRRRWCRYVTLGRHDLDTGTLNSRLQFHQAALAVSVVDAEERHSGEAVSSCLNDAVDHEAVCLGVLKTQKRSSTGSMTARRRQAMLGPGFLHRVDDGQRVGRDGAADDDVNVVLLDEPADAVTAWPVSVALLRR